MGVSVTVPAEVLRDSKAHLSQTDGAPAGSPSQESDLWQEKDRLQQVRAEGGAGGQGSYHRVCALT